MNRLLLLLCLSVCTTLASGAQTSIMSGDPQQMHAYQLMQQAIAKLQSKDPRSALQMLEQASSLWPDMPHLHYYFGMALNDIGDYQRAISEFEQAIKLDPQRVDCMINIATCYQLTGRPAEAANWFERYLQLKPGSPKAAQIKSLIPELRKRSHSNQAAPEATDYFSQIHINGKYRRWSAQRMPLRIFIANGTDDKQRPVSGFRQDYNYMLAEAISTWMTASGNKLAHTYVTDPSQADIICMWTDDPNFHKGAGQIEQGTALRQEHELADGTVQIDRAVITILINSRHTGAPLTNTEAMRACLHEVGHALGIAGHSMNGSDIMFYSEMPTGAPALSARDQRTIARLYQDYPALPSNRY